jgi:predicted metal-dependent phosphoesterase TrpH
MIRADLHAHTTASDGQQTPGELLQLARQIALDVLAITDHDTTAGLDELVALDGLRIIPGIELGARRAGQKIDILGYFIDIQHQGLQTWLANFRQNRLQRGQQIVAVLDRLGFPLEWTRVLALAGGETVGRPHIARAMVEAGHVPSISAAFERYIGDGQPAYVARQTLSPESAIHLIHEAGGAAVLAHPIYVPDFPAVVERLLPAGLDGIEVAYPAHTPEIEAQARQLAATHHLVTTGGSDFHGFDVPNKAMLGAALAPQGSVEQLYQRALHYSA